MMTPREIFRVLWPRTKAERWQLVRYAVVGISATGVYLLCVHLLREYGGLPMTAAASIAFVVVVMMNYVLHYYWTFESSRPHVSSIPRFIVTSTGGMIINLTVVSLGAPLLPQAPTLVLLAGCGIVVAWNYLMSRFWVFLDSPRVD